MYLYVCHMYATALGSQKRVSDPQELELQVLVSSWQHGCWELLVDWKSSEHCYRMSISSASLFRDDYRLMGTCHIEIIYALYPALQTRNSLQNQTTGHRYGYTIKTQYISISQVFHAPLPLPPIATILCSVFM